MIIKINKDYFKNLSKGTHNIKVNLRDGYAEGEFRVDDKITFYIHQEEQFPFTATAGMTFGEWIQSFGIGTSGNNIIWVGFDNKTLYIDPRSDAFGDYSPYASESLGSSSLLFMDSDYNNVSLSDKIVAGAVYGCSICCFDAGTQILMSDNTYKNIEDIIIGDTVLSYNEETGDFEEDVVTNTIVKHDSDDLVYVVLSDGTKLGMRAYHPLLTTEGWKSLRPDLAETAVDIKDGVTLLDIGDTLVGIDGSVTVKEIITREDIPDYDTYNISVKKNHNYVANGVVAHNAACKS